MRGNGNKTAVPLTDRVAAVLQALVERHEVVLAVELEAGTGKTGGLRRPPAERWQVWTAAEAAGGGALAPLLTEALRSGQAGLVAGEDGKIYYLEPVVWPPRAVIAGAGHVGRALAEVVAFLGWSLSVVDDRPEFADPAHLPAQAEVVCADYGEAMRTLPLDRRSFVVSVTSSHVSDLAGLAALAQRPEALSLPYVGMIGSRRRVRALKEALRSQGADEAFIEGLHAPVGLDIGAVTPEELALSIASEMVLTLHGGTGKPSHRLAPGESRLKGLWTSGETQSLAVWRELLGSLRRGERLAVATVIATRGSAPRQAGARMLVWPDGRTVGSTGGGTGESQVRAAALEALRQGRPLLYRVDLTNDPQDATGAICGGYQDVLIEPVE